MQVVLAPVIAMSAFLIAFVVVPISPDWGVADLDIGLLFFLAMAGLAVYAVLFAGWSSNNKYALLGSLRASAQTLSYEVFIGLVITSYSIHYTKLYEEVWDMFGIRFDGHPLV